MHSTRHKGYNEKYNGILDLQFRGDKKAKKIGKYSNVSGSVIQISRKCFKSIHKGNLRQPEVVERRGQGEEPRKACYSVSGILAYF